jgi:type II restriction enzyme
MGQMPPSPGNRISRQVQEARRVLGQLNFDPERSNERSALVLLALLRLTPDSAWADASNPRLRTVEIMDWLRTHYGKDYKPNTRETIRRFTLHQFADALLVEQNPDDPGRPVNSPKWCYQIHPRALLLLRSFGEQAFERQLREYLAEIPGLRDTYARARDLRRIPVTLPDGTALAISPGGQNVLLKQMIEIFCACFTPGGHVLYVGDADAKWAVFEQEALAALGVTVNQHGKMPDLVVHMPDRNWLVLMEAASSHGPVDAKRHRELAALFSASTAGLVYVSCFPSREEMRRYLPQIAWETEVWCADHPTHLIHFNGERFLGPYD